MLVMALGLGFTLLFIVDPLLFDAEAQEDRPVEWISAGLLFLASALFLVGVARRRSGKLGLLLAAGAAGLLFVMGMEEISWMQRVVGFATPDELAEVNWQGEFNLHNVQTDLSENLLYVGSAILLILLPFLRDAAPYARRLGVISDFLPSRWVAAASAPISMFNYGMWNVIPQQMTFFLTQFVLLSYARTAPGRGERLLFLGLAASVAAGQAAFLAAGHLMPQIWDASEYKELFIAIGLACYAADVALRERSEEPMAMARSKPA
jgi:hypothetical protein